MIPRKSIVFVVLISLLSMPLLAEVVTMNFKNTDIRQIYKLVSRIGKINIVMYKSIRCKVSVDYQDMEAEELVFQLAAENNLKVREIGSLFYIYEQNSMRSDAFSSAEDKTIAAILENSKQLQSNDSSILYSAKFRNKDINMIFRDIAEKAGKEYLASKGVVGNADLNVSEVYAGNAFVALAISKGYSVKQRGNKWIVGYGKDFWLD